jgi:cytochrome c biogenesis protein CcmG/thiol:disulfide interchange protein DsbE
MRRLTLPAVVTCLAIALIAVLAYGVNSSGENTSIDSQIAAGHPPLAPSPNDALRLLGGSSRASISSYRGQVVVLNIFASWCTECVGESGPLEQAELRLEGHGGTVVGVTYLDNSYDARRFVSAHHLTYPVLQDVNGNLVRSFGTDAVPETFVIDRAGRVVAVRRYAVSSQWLEQALAKAMAIPA